MAAIPTDGRRALFSAALKREEAKQRAAGAKVAELLKTQAAIQAQLLVQEKAKVAIAAEIASYQAALDALAAEDRAAELPPQA